MFDMSPAEPVLDFHAACHVPGLLLGRVDGDDLVKLTLPHRGEAVQFQDALEYLEQVPGGELLIRLDGHFPRNARREDIVDVEEFTKS
jgi:hypothetical protein